MGPNALLVAVGKRAKFPQKLPKIAHIQMKNMTFPPYGVAYKVIINTNTDEFMQSMATYKESAYRYDSDEAKLQ